jgi:hypothetical protein
VTIDYASRRGEIWTWYWRAWRQRLWKSHLRIFLIVAVLADLILFGTASPHLAVPVAIGAIPIILLILYSQLRFKPQRRTVTIGTSGITTVVGRKSGKISWKNIRSVTEERGYVVVQGSSGNAFIIPPRAFETPEGRARFVEAIRERMTTAG